MSELRASEELLDLAFMVLDHAVASVAEGGPLIPCAVTATPEGRKLARFAAETLEEGHPRGREVLAAACDAHRAALAYDGYLTVESERTDAVFLEAHERGEAGAIVLAQRYRPGGRLRKFQTIGNPASVGPAEPLL